MKDIFKEHSQAPCEACNEYPCTSDCPKDLIEHDINEIEGIKNIFSDYIPNEDILHTDVSTTIGNHLLLIADAILTAQQKWEQTTHMNRIEDLIGQYKYYRDFAQALYDADAFKTVEDVMVFVTHPATFDKLYNSWLELGFPTKEKVSFSIFKKKVDVHKNLQ